MDELALIKAEQQIIGFAAARNGETIEELILAMDISPGEWIEVKRTAYKQLNFEDFERATQYFDRSKNHKQK